MMSGAAEQLLGAVRAVLPKVEGAVQLHEPQFAGNEWAYVKECIDTGWVSSVGSFVTRFEKDIAAACGTQYGVATANGTAALHIALLVAGVKPGDEVIVPALTFIATANAVSYCGAVPHFVDSEMRTLGLDPVALATHLGRIVGPGGVNKETGRRIAAIVPVHIFGHPVDMDALLPVAEKYGIPVVEDAAESLGSLYKGRKAGSMGVISAVSFNGNKIVTTGGGGAVVTNDKAMAERAKHLSTTARVPHQWSFVHDEVGYNYRMPNINAALGCAQLERLDIFVKAKRVLAEAYREALRPVNSVTFVGEPEDARSNYWLNAVMLADAGARDATLTAMHAAGFMCRPVWTLMHRMPMYAQAPRAALPVAEDIEARLINLPSSAKWGMS